MKTSFKVIACMAALAVLMVVQSASAQVKIEGAWRVAEVSRGGQNPLKITVDASHPGRFIVTKTHFSLTNLTNPKRPDLPQQGATDAQKAATWSPLVAFAGTYEMKGNTATFHFIVSKEPSDMAKGVFLTSEFKLDGETLLWTPKTDQNGPVVDPIITKFVRVE
jgi:hypothetical protein